MLAIRLQRHGRQGYPVYRVAVQEASRHPSSGRVVAYVGAYNPHTKEVTIDAGKAEYYLGNGAQPSPRVVRLFSEQKVKLPDWVKLADNTKTAKIRHAEKLRKNQPKEEVIEAAEPEVAAKDSPAGDAEA